MIFFSADDGVQLSSATSLVNMLLRARTVSLSASHCRFQPSSGTLSMACLQRGPNYPGVDKHGYSDVIWVGEKRGQDLYNIDIGGGVDSLVITRSNKSCRGDSHKYPAIIKQEVCEPSYYRCHIERWCSVFIYKPLSTNKLCFCSISLLFQALVNGACRPVVLWGIACRHCLGHYPGTILGPRHVVKSM